MHDVRDHYLWETKIVLVSQINEMNRNGREVIEVSGIEHKNEQIIFYGNPAGILKESKVILDKMFQCKEFEKWLEEKKLEAVWKEGIFERMARGKLMDEQLVLSEPLKKIRIWQLKPDSDFNLRFSNYEYLKKNHLEPTIGNYATVFDGALATNDLEEIYTKFNVDHPDDFEGHSLSISDVVELYDENSRDFYYVDSMGYEKVGFTNEEMKQDMTIKM